MNEALTRKIGESIANGSLFYTETQLNIIRDHEIDFEVCLIDSLSKKPDGQLSKKYSNEISTPFFNPFLPPDPNLLIKNFACSTHNLLLNK